MACRGFIEFFLNPSIIIINFRSEINGNYVMFNINCKKN